MKIITGILFLILPLLSLGQQPGIQPLTVGDTVPDITLTHLYNYPSSTLRLASLQGRLVILDFWSTWCGACIESLPEMHKLQQEFGNRLSVILVNPFAHDSAKKVRAFFAKRKAGTGMEVMLPYSLQQVSLPGYFPFQTIPHYVWINKKGKIIAITSQTEVTAENVRKALGNNIAGMHEKKYMAGFSAVTPLFVKGNGGNGDSFLYRSLFTRYIEGVGYSSGVERNDEGKFTRFYMYNTTAISLLRAAYPEEMDYQPNRIIIESGNSSQLEPDAAEGSGLYTHSFCYDLSIPPSDTSQLHQYLQEDMRRYLGVTVVSGFRKMNCLVLRKTGQSNPIATRGGEPDVESEKLSPRKYIRNDPFSVLVALLNSLPATRSTPVTDSTSIKGNIDLELPADLYDMTLTQIQSFLKKCGIEATETEKIIKVAIIK